MSTSPRKKLRPSGGHRKTASFQTTTLIYDSTYWFCETFHNSRTRMIDTMVQAARSGRQNIAEGSRAAATTSQTELRLINVARASLEELLLDRQVAALEEAFVEGGGYSEQLATERLRQGRSDQPDRTDPSDPKPPACPICGSLMALRTAKAGKNAGSQFWGCTGYPTCKGTAEA